MVSASWSQQRKASGTPLVRVHFAVADCDSCPLRAKCTKAANGKWGRSLTLLPREQQQILEQRRAQQQTDEWKERYDTRAGVEGTISQAVRRCPPAAHALPGPAQDPPGERALCHRSQHHPRRRLAQRHPTRHDPCLSPHAPCPCSMI
ncbi:transposase [Streptomyces sp. NPDC101152]|uniref:transposase n=1 Tax=Streptomyces sp. NPDC101152 TaxID=3366116 RepID=UPI00382601D1